MSKLKTPACGGGNSQHLNFGFDLTVELCHLTLLLNSHNSAKIIHMSIKNILTVDVEDWYHICDIEHVLPSSQWSRCESRVLANVEKILTLLNRFNVKATFFVLGYVAERTPEVVKIIHEEGHEVASHGYGHLQIYKQREDEFLRDLLQSKTLIEGIIG